VSYRNETAGELPRGQALFQRRKTWHRIFEIFGRLDLISSNTCLIYLLSIFEQQANSPPPPWESFRVLLSLRQPMHFVEVTDRIHFLHVCPIDVSKAKRVSAFAESSAATRMLFPRTAVVRFLVVMDRDR
jgi:hypothetical protein